VSVWVEGRAYDYYGKRIVCARRYFQGPLELVDLAFESAAVAGGGARPPVVTRTAHALAPCVLPRVTETLGGVRAPGHCDHRHYRRVTADAGPHVGAVCCEACGEPALSLGGVP
jgi:hypothetical protein